MYHTHAHTHTHRYTARAEIKRRQYCQRQETGVAERGKVRTGQLSPSAVDHMRLMHKQDVLKWLPVRFPRQQTSPGCQGRSAVNVISTSYSAVTRFAVVSAASLRNERLSQKVMHFAAFPAAFRSAWTREPAAKEQSESSRLRWRRLTVMSSTNGKIRRRCATCPKDLTNRYSGEFSATVQR